MQNFESLGRELEKRGKTEDLRKIAESADGQLLSRMIDSSAVEQAAKTGDTEALKNMVSKVLSTDEGKRLAQSLRKLMQD